jgi:Leucine-rich repeat (LRR) protein
MPACSLQHLRTLALEGLSIASFPSEVVIFLKQLTALDLCNNSFKELPNSFSKISNLQSLDLSLNKKLHLEHIDVDTIAALPHIQIVDLRKSGETGWSGKDMNVACAISKRLPQLEILFKKE